MNLKRRSIFMEIDAERHRAEALFNDGRLEFTAAHANCPDILRLAALVEEVGEVARAIHDSEENHLRRELIQLAGVAVAWLEAL